jgi:hypothetical protein
MATMAIKPPATPGTTFTAAAPVKRAAGALALAAPVEKVVYGTGAISCDIVTVGTGTTYAVAVLAHVGAVRSVTGEQELQGWTMGRTGVGMTPPGQLGQTIVVAVMKAPDGHGMPWEDI